MFISAQCIQGCESCDSFTDVYVDGQTTTIEIACDACQSNHTMVDTNLCYGEQNYENKSHWSIG